MQTQLMTRMYPVLKYTFFIPILLTTISFSGLKGQNTVPLFENGSVKVNSYVYHEAKDSSLHLEVCFPPEDTGKARPFLLYIHGGGFRNGKYQDKWIREFSCHMAKKGIVTASMEYELRLKGQSFGCDCPASKKKWVFLETARDLSRAVKFVLEYADSFHINTNQIIVIGSSAGAETAVHAVYQKESRIDRNGRILPDDFQYGGLISLAGALSDIFFITAENAVPTQSFHGTCDKLVPYASAPHHYCEPQTPGSLMLYGGYSISERLKSLGKPYYLVSFCGGGHEWASWPIIKYREEILDFIVNDVINSKKRQIHLVVPTDKPDCPDKAHYIFCD